MGRSAIPSADPTTLWLEDLIEVMEAVASSNEPCAPAIVRMFSHRLELPRGWDRFRFGCRRAAIRARHILDHRA
jgi:hypothetical protein